MLRINGTFASGINCLISIPWYSTDGQKLLIPEYTVALGHTEQVTSGNQQRLFVAFNELIEPDGYTATFQNSSGTDQIGQFGLRDKVDRHLLQVFGTSIALAAVGGLAQIGNLGNSAVLTPSSQYRAGFTQNMSTSAMQVLDRFASVLPTFVIREGCRNQIYLPIDLYLPAVSSHNVQEVVK